MNVCACGQPLWAPQSIERGYCEYWRTLGRWRDAIAGLRPFPYGLPPGYEPPAPRAPAQT